MGVSILSDGVGKPFLVRPAADDGLIITMILRMLTIQIKGMNRLINLSCAFVGERKYHTKPLQLLPRTYFLIH